MAFPKQKKEKEPATNSSAPKRVAGFDLIVAPHISEKASLLAAASGGAQYVFRVSLRATKLLLKKAVQDRYAVKVRSVRVIRAQGKSTRRGAIVGHKPDFKKAIVALEPGQTIPEF